jgi:hypothetical protein
MNFFDHKDLGNHLLQLCPKVVTPTGTIKTSAVTVIVVWISKAWIEVPVNIIPKSFLKCC